MHIPSKIISEEMYSTDASLWYVPAIDNTYPFAILIKAPTNCIKAIISKCKVELVFAKEDNYLCKGIRIHDMPDCPVMFYDIQFREEEHAALIDILKSDKIPVFLYNEMDICFASSYASLGSIASLELIDFIGDTTKLNTVNIPEDVSKILDFFVYSTDNKKTFENNKQISLMYQSLNFDEWEVFDNIFIGLNESHSITIDDKNEGDNFEKIVWSTFESIFPTTIRKGPNIIIGNKTRELTDIFAYSEDMIILIETKDLSILSAGLKRNSDRKTSGVQKQIKKAIEQLIGGVNALNKNNIVMDTSSIKLNFDRELPKHCIILVTEIMAYGNWTEIFNSIKLASEKTKAYFHLMDYREIVSILKACSGDIHLINKNLMTRFNFSIEKESVMIRSAVK